MPSECPIQCNFFLDLHKEAPSISLTQPWLTIQRESHQKLLTTYQKWECHCLQLYQASLTSSPRLQSHLNEYFNSFIPDLPIHYYQSPNSDWSSPVWSFYNRTPVRSKYTSFNPLRVHTKFLPFLFIKRSHHCWNVALHSLLLPQGTHFPPM